MVTGLIFEGIDTIRKRVKQIRDPVTMYQSLYDMGYKFGTLFQSISRLSIENEELLAIVQIPYRHYGNQIF